MENSEASTRAMAATTVTIFLVLPSRSLLASSRMTMGKKQITEAISPMLFHRKNFTLLCLLAGSSRLAFFHSWLPMMTRIRSMTSAPMSQYIFCSSGIYQVPLSIRMAHTSAARASTHRMTAATRLPVALFLLAAVTTAGRLPVLPVEASTNSRSTFFFSAKLGHSFSITKNRAKCRFHCTKHEADAQGLFCGERTTAGGSPRRCGLFFFAAQQQYPGKRKGKRRRISLRGFG